MAMNVYLKLKANGTEIKGDSTVTSDGREDSIECMSFQDAVMTEREATSSLSTGRRTYGPMTITKRIDKSSPLIAQALCENQEIEAEFKFYRPNPAGDGSTEQFYTIEIKRGRISAITRKVPETFIPATNNLPAIEEVSFSFGYITWTYTDGGVSHTDDWKEQT